MEFLCCSEPPAILSSLGKDTCLRAFLDQQSSFLQFNLIMNSHGIIYNLKASTTQSWNLKYFYLYLYCIWKLSFKGCVVCEFVNSICNWLQCNPEICVAIQMWIISVAETGDTWIMFIMHWTSKQSNFGTTRTRNTSTFAFMKISPETSTNIFIRTKMGESEWKCFPFYNFAVVQCCLKINSS